MATAEHYYEAHITLDPVFDEERDKVSSISEEYKFRLAHLIMQKGKEDTPESSKRDTFMTGHGKDLDDISNRIKGLVQKLLSLGYGIRRYKIEDIVLDSRIKDEFKLL